MNKDRPPMPDTDPYAKYAQSWHEKMSYPGRYEDLTLSAASFQAWLDTTLPCVAKLLPRENSRECMEEGVDHYRIDEWTLYRRPLPVWTYHVPHPFNFRDWRPEGWRRCELNLYRCGKEHCMVRFDGPVFIPKLVDASGTLWMSLTPSEVMTQRPGIRAARGEVLIGGLGMAWAAQAIRRKKGVRKVVVAEKNAAIAAFFGSRLAEQAGCPYEIEVGDFYETAARYGYAFDSIVADIWPSYNDAPYDHDLHDLKRKYSGRLWAWGDYAQPH